jgi:hypothetical protein
MLHRLLGISHIGPSEEEMRAADNAEIERLIKQERQGLKQTVQRIESGSRIPMTWASAMKLINDPDRYPLTPEEGAKK